MRRLLALLLAGVIVACGWVPADEQVLRLFFERSRTYDTTGLAPIATVTFNPQVEGVVERFEILARDDQSLQGRLRRQARVSATVWSAAGRRSERTLLVTLDRDAAGGWKVTGFRWEP